MSDCTDFRPHAFKPNQCKQCFKPLSEHSNVPTSAIEKANENPNEKGTATSKNITSLNFSHMGSKKITHVFPIDFTSTDLYEAVFAKLYPNYTIPVNVQGCVNGPGFLFSLLYQGKKIPESVSNPQDKATFDQMKQTMTTKSVILVVERMQGGTTDDSDTMNDMDTHIEHFFKELNNELIKIVVHPNNTCMICLKKKNCFKIPCSQPSKCINIICKNCLPEYYAKHKFNFQCVVCKKLCDLETLLMNAEFKNLPNKSVKMTLSEQFQISYAQFKQVIELTRYIDFQICRCGGYFINTTMYSRQNCPKCQRWMCFFCNENWDSNTMQNQQYTCGLPSCTYQQLLTFEMEESKAYPPLHAPSMRFCPKCGILGAFDYKCKFHTCANCQHTFCYLCLKTQVYSDCPQPSECAAGSYREKCADPPVRQAYTIFPRIGN